MFEYTEIVAAEGVRVLRRNRAGVMEGSMGQGGARGARAGDTSPHVSKRAKSSTNLMGLLKRPN